MGAGSSTLPYASAELTDLQQLKIKGDSAMQIDNFPEAVYYYTKALDQLDSHNDGDDELTAVIMCNRSAAYSASDQYFSSLMDSVRVIAMRPKYVKAYFRAAKAAYHLDRIVEAKEYCLKAMAMIPGNKTVMALLDDIVAIEGGDKAKGTTMSPSKTSTQRVGVGCVFSWGLGSNGQLGLGRDVKEKNNPTAIVQLRGKHIIDVGAGAMHSVAVTATGDSYSWGDNNHQQLGYLKEDFHDYNLIAEPRLVPGLVGIKVSAVTCGAGHTLVLTENHHVLAWGMSGLGQCGLGEAALEVKEIVNPTKIDFFDDLLSTAGLNAEEKQSPIHVTAINAGLAHSFFLMSDGSVYCCGHNNYGQLGLSNMDIDKKYVEAQEEKEKERVKTPAEEMGLIVKLPKSNPHLVDTPQRVPHDFEGFSVTHVSCGGGHTLVVNENGDVFATGSNSAGQLGLADNDDRYGFVKLIVDNTNDASIVTAIAIARATNITNVSIIPVKFAFVCAGEEFSVMISETKTVYTCGLGIAGALGHGEPLESLSYPREVKYLTNIEEASASGQSQVLAVSTTGEIYHWGTPGNLAQLATLPEANVVVKEPVRFSSLSKRKQVRSLVCGRKHQLMVTVGAYAPFCYIRKGLQQDTKSIAEELNIPHKSVTKVYAGQKISFSIQAKDVKDEVMSSGGNVFHSIIEHESLDYEWRLKRQNLDLVHTVDIYDDMDGTYSGDFKLMLEGSYQLHISLDDLPISGSPFELQVAPAPNLSAPRCFCWWGKFAVEKAGYTMNTTSANKEEGKTETASSMLPSAKVSATIASVSGTMPGYGRELECFQGDNLMFTVSAKDKFGNRADASNAIISVRWRENLEEKCKRLGTHKGDDMPFVEMGEISKWPGSSSAIFPCSLDSRHCKELTFYWVDVVLGEMTPRDTFLSDVKEADDDEQHDELYSHLNHVEGSPFKLFVKEKPDETEEENDKSKREDAHKKGSLLADEDEGQGMEVTQAKSFVSTTLPPLPPSDEDPSEDVIKLTKA